MRFLYRRITCSRMLMEISLFLSIDINFFQNVFVVIINSDFVASIILNLIRVAIMLTIRPLCLKKRRLSHLDHILLFIANFG